MFVRLWYVCLFDVFTSISFLPSSIPLQKENFKKKKEKEKRNKIIIKQT